MSRVLYLVVCAAPPAGKIHELIGLVDGWRVRVIATPRAVDWIDHSRVVELTGHPVRHDHRLPEDPDDMPKADAIVVVPATFNTVNKWAAGISDTVALGLVNEAIGLRLPIVVVPYAKPTLAAHPAYAASLRALGEWGVTVLPNEAIRTPTDRFDWQPVLDALSVLCGLQG